jgi:hypothetical protein
LEEFRTIVTSLVKAVQHCLERLGNIRGAKHGQYLVTALVETDGTQKFVNLSRVLKRDYSQR